MTLHSGRLGVKGDVAFTAARRQAGRVEILRRREVDDWRTTDRLLREDFVKWSSLAITGHPVPAAARPAAHRRIVARQPMPRVVYRRGTAASNVSEVLAPQKETQKGSFRKET
jgi:hypothetical protein